MRRTLMTAVAAAALATVPLGACAQTDMMDSAQSDMQSRSTAQTQMDTRSSSHDQMHTQAQTQNQSNAMGHTGAAQTQSTAQTTFTDTQLRAFVAASAEIDPINRSLQANPSGDQSAAVQQIRDILARHNLDANTYNAIARQASQDQALAARIAAMQSASGGAGASAPNQ